MVKILEEHAGYLSDRVKLDAYEAAISGVVTPGDSVMDLGCGSGILGLMALRAGADKVVFVEEGEIIEIAQRTIVEAGFADRSEFKRCNSFELDLDKKVDVVLCDHVGYFGFDYELFALLADAKQRFLKPGGTIVPAEVELQLSLIESVDGRKDVDIWRDGSIPSDYQWVDSIAANMKLAKNLVGDNLLADIATLASIATGAEIKPYLSWKTEFECRRDGRLDGVAGSFICRLHDETYMSNSPVADAQLNRPQAFLPLLESVEISAGERIVVDLMARPLDHVIGWIVDFPEQGKKFSSNTFNGLLLDRTMLNRTQPDRTASLNRRGNARKIILSYCDGKRTVAEIDALVRQEHPDLFPSERAMSTFVNQVLSWDTGE